MYTKCPKCKRKIPAYRIITVFSNGELTKKDCPYCNNDLIQYQATTNKPKCPICSSPISIDFKSANRICKKCRYCYSIFDQFKEPTKLYLANNLYDKMPLIALSENLVILFSDDFSHMLIKSHNKKMALDKTHAVMDLNYSPSRKIDYSPFDNNDDRPEMKNCGINLHKTQIRAIYIESNTSYINIENSIYTKAIFEIYEKVDYLQAEVMNYFFMKYLTR